MLALILAVAVRMLSLPAHATVEPLGTRPLMAASADGTVAATVTLNGFHTRAAVWSANGRMRVANASGSVVSFDPTGALLLDADPPRRVAGTRASAIDFASCESFPKASIGPVLAGVLSNGALVATMRSPAMVDIDDTSGQNAPVVLYLRSHRCLNLGNGVAIGTAGLFTAGYTAYIANVPAPSNVASSRERFVAMRWHDRTREPLGDGVALAINTRGSAAGADVVPGSVYDPAPHARLWPAGGTAIEVTPNAPLSVAYAIDDRDRVTGMLEDESLRHYAFVWDHGTLRRLDDAVHAPGWHFECGYAFTPDGGIAGIGTYRGNAAAFIITGL